MGREYPDGRDLGQSVKQGSEFRIDSRNPFPGVYRARVEFNADPKRLKRVKVRIPSMHGIPEVDENAIKTKDLPWAVCENKSTSGYDMGSYIVPKVGSFLWVKFESGDPSRYVYGGGIHGKDSKEPHQMGLFHEDYDEDNIPAGQWDAPVGENEIPKDAFNGKEEDDFEPTRDVLHKSLKGHTIVMDDEDEKESLSIIDRAGQLIKFISPLTDDVNRTGDESFQRGVKSAEPGHGDEPSDYEEDSFQSKAIFFIRDLAGQLFRSIAEFGKEKIEIVSHNFYGDDNRRTALEMNSGDGNVNYMLLAEDEDSDNRVYIKADAINPKLELVVVEGGEEISRVELTDKIFQYATDEMEIQSMSKMRIHADDEINISADDGNLEMYADIDFNIESNVDTNISAGVDFNAESSADTNLSAGGNSSRESGGSIHNSAGGAINNDGSTFYMQSGTASGAGSASPYGGDSFDYSPPSDDTTWEDGLPERFID